MTQCKFFTNDERLAAEQARSDAINAWRAQNFQTEGWPAELEAIARTFLPPGSMWFEPWYFDPAKPADVERLPALIQERRARPTGPGIHGLSIHYLETWALKRPPICVICPGGGGWEMDMVSSNGTGWTIEGDVPNITANRSIWVGQGKGPPREFHGWLSNGVFRLA